MDRRTLLRFGTAGAALGAAGLVIQRAFAGPAHPAKKFEIDLSPAEWKKKLTADQFYILREEGTEPPGTSPLLNEHRKGTFACRGCELPLFPSTTKFESGTGWPSFYQPLPNAVETRVDGTLGMQRTEVHCRRCGGHLGHVFNDGPKPTGLRYCMDGVALDFHAA